MAGRALLTSETLEQRARASLKSEASASVTRDEGRPNGQVVGKAHELPVPVDELRRPPIHKSSQGTSIVIENGGIAF